MPKINVLEKQVAELIAAGEVVERPASIVKELIENAVDAGSTSITVEIQAGGIRYIRVTDNGCGIEREDVPKAFLRHATSKVRVQEDLGHIMTMGFRGEALASIAAMSHVELLTRTAEQTAGTSYKISGGEELGLEDAGCPVGTTITVRDVFYNTPARMKFLKKDVSEGNSVAAVVEKAALSNPEIAFKFIRDGSVKLQTPGDGQLISAIRCVLGKEFASNVLLVHYSQEQYTLDGFISKTSFSRGSRSMQNFFINHRFVRSKTCMAALEEAYKNALMVGKFPSCVLNLTIPPETVDVNVHPAKIEVRFADERKIFDLVYYGCKTTLHASDTAPELELKSVSGSATYNPFHTQTAQTPVIQERISAQEYRKKYMDDKSASVPIRMDAVKPVGITENPDAVLSRISTSSVLAMASPGPLLDEKAPLEVVFHRKDTQTLSSSNQSRPTPRPSPNLDIDYEEPQQEGPKMIVPDLQVKDPYEDAKLVGEIFNTYLVVQSEDALLLVDKHAAHERLLFNKLMRQGIGEERQLLITPISVQLAQEEYTVILENKELLEKAGISAEDFGDGCVLIREVSPILAEMDLAEMVTEFAKKLLSGSQQLVSQRLEEMYHTIACRSAIKANDRTGKLSLESLIQLLREDGDVAHCPHGRPVSIKLTRREIEKKFGRLG